jgi:hypothetical protein
MTAASRIADRDMRRRAKQYLVEGEITRSSHWVADRA